MNPTGDETTFNPIHSRPPTIDPQDLPEHVTSFKKTSEVNVTNIQQNTTAKTCPTVLDIGKKINNKYFIPSQFPNLTKIKTFKVSKIKKYYSQQPNKQPNIKTKKSKSKSKISKKSDKFNKNVSRKTYNFM